MWNVSKIRLDGVVTAEKHWRHRFFTRDKARKVLKLLECWERAWKQDKAVCFRLGLVKSSYDIYYIFARFFEVISAAHQLKNDLHYLRQPAGTIQIDYWRSTKINFKSVTLDCFAILNFEFTVLPDINSSVDGLLKFMICALHIVSWKMCFQIEIIRFYISQKVNW